MLTSEQEDKLLHEGNVDDDQTNRKKRGSGANAALWQDGILVYEIHQSLSEFLSLQKQHFAYSNHLIDKIFPCIQNCKLLFCTFFILVFSEIINQVNVEWQPKGAFKG